MYTFVNKYIHTHICHLLMTKTSLTCHQSNISIFFGLGTCFIINEERIVLYFNHNYVVIPVDNF